MSGGMEVIPVMAETEDGQEYVADFEVSSGSAVGRDGSYRGWEDDWTVDSEGRVHHAYMNQAPEQEGEPGDFNEKEYFDDLASVYPIKEMHAFLKANSTDAEYAAFNNILNNGDLGQVNAALEQVFEEFQVSGWEVEAQAEEQVEEQQVDETPDLTTEQVESIYQQYPVEEMQEFLRNNFDADAIASFDQIIEQGSFQQVDAVYELLYEAYTQNS